MPAQRLGSHSASVFRYDVVARDSRVQAKFICHVALADEGRHDVLRETAVAVAHMGPPLERKHDGFPIHACGGACLGVGEMRQVSVFVDEHISEYEADKVRGESQYTIMPHCREPDECCSVRRFNCAGFVIEAYRYAGIDLVTTDTAFLPTVSLDTLSSAYPDLERVLRSARHRSKFGLQGDGPWPVVMAGYVLNALNRSAEDIRREPYQPRQGDELFLPDAS
jgi:hypothetical protein